MFHTQMKNGITFLTAGALASDGIRHGFSTRLGGVSPAPWDSLNLDDRRGDDIANVQENFRRLCAALDMDVRRAVLSRQIHRDDVRLVTAADCGKGLWVSQDYDSADALITDVPGVPPPASLARPSAPCRTPSAAIPPISAPPLAPPSGRVALKRTTTCPPPSVRCWGWRPSPS